MGAIIFSVASWTITERNSGPVIEVVASAFSGTLNVRSPTEFSADNFVLLIVTNRGRSQVGLVAAQGEFGPDEWGNDAHGIATCTDKPIFTLEPGESTPMVIKNEGNTAYVGNVRVLLATGSDWIPVEAQTPPSNEVFHRLSAANKSTIDSIVEQCGL